jgi:hypothetical protein
MDKMDRITATALGVARATVLGEGEPSLWFSAVILPILSILSNAVAVTELFGIQYNRQRSCHPRNRLAS